MNDRLLLGLKGTMSEFELNLLRQRSLETIRQKASRGELKFHLPIGLVWSELGKVEVDSPHRGPASNSSGLFQDDGARQCPPVFALVPPRKGMPACEG
jgi:hypothetical protein